MKQVLTRSILASAILLGGGAANAGEVAAKAKGAAAPSFAIEKASITLDSMRNVLLFRMTVGANAGAVIPDKAGKFAGAGVHAYVWPTTLDPSIVGFESKSGILAFAVTIHPDFSDDPYFEDDGSKWHSHWVVLAKDSACSGGDLKVVDIPLGAKPRVPRTWPGVPLLIDSPGWRPVFRDNVLEVRAPFDAATDLKGARFDAVTAGLRVNANLHAPLLCVSNIFHVASGDLSMPGVID